MNCLSIRQPWAWAIIHAGKDIENRIWSTSFRGRFLVHASKNFDHVGYGFLVSNQHLFNIQLPNSPDFLLGGIIGSVNLVNCVTSHLSPWFFGPFGLVLDSPRMIDFIKLNGSLGFFDLPFTET